MCEGAYSALQGVDFFAVHQIEGLKEFSLLYKVLICLCPQTQGVKVFILLYEVLICLCPQTQCVKVFILLYKVLICLCSQTQGVKVFILLYKEIEAALMIKSIYSKQVLMSKHENIKVNT